MLELFGHKVWWQIDYFLRKRNNQSKKKITGQKDIKKGQKNVHRFS
jgi:hypothetical protein